MPYTNCDTVSRSSKIISSKSIFGTFALFEIEKAYLVNLLDVLSLESRIIFWYISEKVIVGVCILYWDENFSAQ